MHATSRSATTCRTATDIMPTRRSPARGFSVFLCPSDGECREPRRSSGRRTDEWTPSTSAMSRSAGTTTNSPNNTAPTNTWATQGSTGVFWWYQCYGIKNITGWHVEYRRLFRGPGDQRRVDSRPRRRSPIPIRGTPITGVSGAGGAAQQYDANQNPAAILAGLNACNTAWNSRAGSITSAGSSGRSARSG